MIIAFEGLPCACKSSLSRKLATDLQDAYVIPEFVLDTSYGISDEFCEINDIAKLHLADYLSKQGKTVFLDRSPLSTLLYARLKSEKDYEKVATRYAKNDLQRLCDLPDLIIYLRISPATSITRAKSIGRYNVKFAWFAHTAKAYDYYEEMLVKNRDLYTDRIKVIDAETSFENLQENIMNIIKDI